MAPSLDRAERLLGALGYALELRARPLRRRSDAAGLPDQLAMSAEERLQSAANLHNTLMST